MPLYEYVCSLCDAKVETLRSVSERDDPLACSRGHLMERIFSVPAMQVWNCDRAFPNAVTFGSGKFPSKAAYEAHLKSHDMAETRTDGKIYRPHGNTVVRSG